MDELRFANMYGCHSKAIVHNFSETHIDQTGQSSCKGREVEKEPPTAT